MSYENVKLWFAKDSSGEIVTIDEVNLNKNNTYSCPMCGSNLIPKAIKSAHITSHFAHIDASKCNAETMVHWWFKNTFLERGDSFIVVSDKERKYMCEEVLIEQSFHASGQVYRPDVTVVTKCGKTIFFEMDYSNKKKVQDYIDIWLELRHIVVEVDIKKLMLRDKIPSFKALFYHGKCFNMQKNDIYYHTIGEYKEQATTNQLDKKTKEYIKKLDWFWDDVQRYKSGEVDIHYVLDIMDYFEKEDLILVHKVLKKLNCVDVIDKYYSKKTNKIVRDITTLAENYFKSNYNDYLQHSGSRINIYDEAERCYITYSIFDEDLLDICKKHFEANFAFAQQKELKSKWEFTTKNFINSIGLNGEYIELIEKLKAQDYEIDIWFNYRTVDKYLLNVSLKYISGITAARWEIEVLNTEEFSEITSRISLFTEQYFSYLDKIKDINSLSSIAKSLAQKYNGLLEISHELWLQDIYCIEIYNGELPLELNQNYYISNSGILSDCRSNDMILKTSEPSKIYQYIANDVNEKIKKVSSLNCIGCKRDFDISVGEIKFFLSKGFDLPRRCKKCRDLQKTNLGGRVIESKST